MTAPRSFLDALVSSQRAPELVDADDIFGFLIGSWNIEAVLHDPDGRTQRSKGEIHASWVLEGRAIQDYSFFPAVRTELPAFQLKATDTPLRSEPMIGRFRLGALPLLILQPTKRVPS
jgi:hypothetical protein